ncbi:MAG: valine--tRNA ligase [Chloroflexota bacterium]|nr:valine--tRNA ligase [Chloroflexota bacterium]|tara:strand:- start:2906 stop:5503 length:2598 start_codon:yes stop_codon:yes gene_type:complete
MNYISEDIFPKNYKHLDVENKIIKEWDKENLYSNFNPDSKKKIFSVDTPPPTASGYLHIGHVFSYSHQDFIVRFRRMRGEEIFYPMGWDDNGLPTERRVQDYFNVKCDPEEKSVQNILDKIKENGNNSSALKVSRKNFIELCHIVTTEDEKVFKELFMKIALSVDWNHEYTTIQDLPRELAQKSFIDLYEKGFVYNTDNPSLWDPEFQTAVAQAEIEDREMPGAFHDIRFQTDSNESFVISTTRPELLAACVGVAAHPDDKRFKHLIGKNAITPLFGVKVPVFGSELVDMEKGTGILMVCTFGDNVDVQWWQENNLDTRIIVNKYGRLNEVSFGSNEWESKNPEEANNFYSRIAGKTLKQAKTEIVEMLSNKDNFEADVALVGEPKQITHSVRFYERSKTPLEILSTRQWFVKLMDKKELLIEKSNQIDWHPDFMRKRFENWTENLQFDWCISRQRFFGVPFPLWYKLDEKCRPDYNNPIVADLSDLPVDPTEDPPSGYTESDRGKSNGFIGEKDVFDTWFTSSLTPQIGGKWDKENSFLDKVFPYDIRPQSHEIIRTWAFYTVVKSALHHNEIPWKNVIISGWVLDPDRKKMSKSKGNVVVPNDLIETYGADAVRYWAANARLGSDTANDEQVFKVGKKLVVKLFNASKFVLNGAPESVNISDITEPLDLSTVHLFNEYLDEITKSMENFQFSEALNKLEDFFWNYFTDNYIELVKNRSKFNDYGNKTISGLTTLRLILENLLKLFAPFIPMVTEEIWGWIYRNNSSKYQSIHLEKWPEKINLDFKNINSTQLVIAREAIGAVRKEKTNNELSLGSDVNHVSLSVNKEFEGALRDVIDDVKDAARSKSIEINIGSKEGIRASID